MSNENWMARLLGDARDLALQTSRAKIQAQQRQLELADRRIAELTEQTQSLARQLLREQARADESDYDLAELAAKFGLLEAEYDAVHDELAAAREAVSSLQTEYGKAAIRARTLEVRLTSVLRRLLGDAGVLALRDLLEIAGVDESEFPSEPERGLLDCLEHDDQAYR